MAMEKFYETKKFLKLFKKWNDKLKKEGNFGIEDFTTEGEPRELLQSNFGCFSSSTDAARTYSEDKERYFQLAAQHYWILEQELPKKSEMLQVFRMYKDGATMAAISRRMGISTGRIKKFLVEQEKRFLPRRAPKLTVVE